MITKQNTSNLLNYLCRLTMTERDLQFACNTYQRLSMTESEILSVARLHKVQTVLDSTLAKIRNRLSEPIAPSLVELLGREQAQSMAHLQLLKTEVVSTFLTKENQKLGIKSTFLKGMSMARFYPEDCPRWMRDVDVLVDTAENSLKICRWFVDRGFVLDDDELPWFKGFRQSSAPQDLYGQIFLRKKIGLDYARVDLHFNRYSVGYSGYLVNDLLVKTQQSAIDGHPVFVLTAEACLILLFAHMPSMGYVAIKDINDFVAIVSQTKVDWDEVTSSLIESRLVPQAIETADQILGLYDHTRVVESAKALKDNLPAKDRRRIWTVHNRDWKLRAKVNALHTFEFEHRFMGISNLRALVSALQCYFYYLPRFKSRIGNRTFMEKLLLFSQPRYDLLKAEIGRDVCIRSVPISIFRANNFDWTTRIFIDRLQTWFPGIKVRHYDRFFLYIEVGSAQIAVNEVFLSICSIDLIIDSQAREVAQQLSEKIEQTLLG